MSKVGVHIYYCVTKVSIKHRHSNNAWKLAELCFDVRALVKIWFTEWMVNEGKDGSDIIHNNYVACVHVSRPFARAHNGLCT